MKYGYITILLLMVILFSGCLYNVGTSDMPKVYFDMSHHEIFSPNNENPSSYTELYYKFEEQGFEMGIFVDPLTLDVLSDADTLVIAGPMRGFSSQEIVDIRSFVKDGGNLLVLVHIFPTVNDLIEDFGIVSSTFIVCDPENQINVSPRDIYLKDVEIHPITEGVESIAVFGSWSLITSDPANIVAWTSGNAWLDTNSNRQFDVDSEELERLGLVAVSEYGSGKVVVIADDAVFIDEIIVMGDNRLLRDNIISWFKINEEL